MNTLHATRPRSIGHAAMGGPPPGSARGADARRVLDVVFDAPAAGPQLRDAGRRAPAPARRRARADRGARAAARRRACGGSPRRAARAAAHPGSDAGAGDPPGARARIAAACPVSRGAAALYRNRRASSSAGRLRPASRRRAHRPYDGVDVVGGRATGGEPSPKLEVSHARPCSRCFAPGGSAHRL